MDYLKVHIQEPYWGAWKRFEWTDKSPGIGIAVDLVEKAIKNAQMLEVTVDKYGTRYVNPQVVENAGDMYVAKFNRKLYVYPWNKMSDIKGV